MRRSACLATALLVSSCSGNEGTTEPVPVSPVESIQVEPLSPTLLMGQSVQLSARALDAAGNVIPSITFEWNSLNTAIATVDGNGLVLGKGTGPAAISAKAGGKTGFAHLTVNWNGTNDTQPPVLVEASLSPATMTLTQTDSFFVFVVRAQDEGSGIRTAGVTVEKDGSTFSRGISSDRPIVGTTQNGTWEMKVGRGAFDGVGTYVVRRVQLEDAAGNAVLLNLSASGAPPTFSITQ